MTNHHATTGLSIGATNLAGTRADQSVIHPAVLRIESGAWLSGFIERVGDPVPLVAPDGTLHRPERLLADALDATARAVGHPQTVTDIGIAVPAHWTPGMIAAMAAELPSATIVSDTAAAVAALRSAPGLPSHGVVVLCDLGGSGASIALVDAGSGYEPIGETVRHPEFSGDLVDQLILAEVLAGRTPTDPTGTAQVTSLTRLREAARLAKHRLSSETATALATGDTSIRLTRADLEAVIDAPFSGFLTVLTETLDRFGVRPGAVSAVATFGGCARIPMVSQRLSAQLQVPVITTAHPALTAAAGAALAARAARAVETPTELTPTLPPAPAATAPAAALAWADDPEPEPDPVMAAWTVGRPELQFSEPDLDEAVPARRGPLIAFGVAAAAALTALAAYGLTSFDRAPDKPVPVVATVTATPTTESAAPVGQPGPAATSGTGPVVVPVAGVPARRVPIRSAPVTVTAPPPAPATPTATPPSPTVPTTTATTQQPPTSTQTTTPTVPPTSTAPPTTEAPPSTTPAPLDPGPGDGETTPPLPIDPGDGGSE